MKRRTLLIALVVACGFWCPRAWTAAIDDVIKFVPDEEVIEELKSAPKHNVEREHRLRELYVQAGAKPEEITLQEVKTGREKDPALHNVIVTKKGRTDSVIVVGGHLDKVAVGSGIIDDWSGACLAQNLYQTIRPIETKHTFVFIGFAYEEAGLLGSRAYVGALSAEDKKKVKAMVNLECLGPADPFIWTNGSTDELAVVAHQVADEHKLPLNDHVILGVGADSIPFEQAGIPNITFDGLPTDRFDLIHSPKDDFANVKPESYLSAYRLTTRFLVHLDGVIDELEIKPRPAPATRGHARPPRKPPVNVAGAWKLAITEEDGSIIERTVKLTQDGDKLRGVYVRDGKESPLEEPKLEGDELVFRNTTEQGGHTFRFTYRGKVSGDTIKGTMTYDIDGERGSLRFEGKREAARDRKPQPQQAVYGISAWPATGPPRNQNGVSSYSMNSITAPSRDS